VSLATRLLSANPGAQVTTALTGALTTPGAKGAFQSATFEGIASYTVTGSSVSSYTFTSIPQTYKHLYIVADIFSTTVGEDIAIQVGNGSVDTGTNYSGGWTRHIATSVTSVSDLNNSRIRLSDGGSPTSGNSTTLDMYMPMYSSTTAHKPVMAHSGNHNRGQDLVSGKWRGNSAIDTIKFYMLVGNLEVNTRISIFGIKG
jgi:hypothetical protein